jgi:hypothetical protein
MLLPVLVVFATAVLFGLFLALLLSAGRQPDSEERP